MADYQTLRALFLVLAFVNLADLARAEDWPMWRKDASRSAATAEQLPSSLALDWTLQLPAPRPAWPAEQGKVRFDVSYEPIVAGNRLIVPSMVRDSVTAYNVATAKRLWRFHANGPVRFAPVASGNRVLFGSDDGYLYCLDIENGTLVWKFRGGPSDRKILGNDRLVSMWPVRGGPVISGQTVYFTAGIWPFMGTFVHALDVDSGEVIWTNSGSGSDYIVQPHNSPAFAGVAPQGYLTLTDDMLLVSGGMTVPAAYDRHTGQFLYFRPGDREFGKGFGGYEVTAGEDWFANRGGLYRLSDGKPLVKLSVAVRSSDFVLGTVGKQLLGLGTRLIKFEVTKIDEKGKSKTTRRELLTELWRARLPEGVQKIHLQAGDWVLASDDGPGVYALKIPPNTNTPDNTDQAERDAKQNCEVAWHSQVEGTVWNMLVADQRLFVINTAGAIFCFSAAKTGPHVVRSLDETIAQPSDQRADSAVEKRVQSILREVPISEGYAVLDGQNSDLAAPLARTTKLHVIVLEPDAQARRKLRQRLELDQLLGVRVAVLEGDLDGDPGKGMLPPFMADLLVATLNDRGNAERAVQASREMVAILRPYGGAAVLNGGAKQLDAIAKVFAYISPPGAATILGIPHGRDAADIANQIESQSTQLDRAVVLRRLGPLPGSGSWTHQNADAGNTLVSPDTHPRTPLGLLWFGGPPNRGVLPRHGHGPTPQVIGGRLFIEGGDMLRAVDVYTGRLLWQREFKGVGLYYDVTSHHPGAGAIGGNFVCTRDAVYLVWERVCLKLDPATGATLNEFHLPADAGGERPYWGHLAVYEDVLVAGSSPMVLLARADKSKKIDDENTPIYSRFGEGSQRIVVMDRHDGRVLWKRDAKFNFRHNAIAVGDGKLFCLDRMTPERLASLNRRGKTPSAEFCLYGLDLPTGDVLWQSTEHAFGTWLAYNPLNKLLLQAGSRNRDRATDDVGRGISVHQGDTGKLLWRNEAEYGGPPLFYPDEIIMQGTAFDLMSGAPKQRRHPITDETLPWRFARNYGCNTAIGCVNLLTFRSAAAGYFDLANDGGTGNFGGFRSSCTANLIPADGVINAPDYTRTCTCSYQNQCSLALIHMPEVEMWTFNPIPPSTKRVAKLGINFGAPGDRRTADGVLWLDYPSVGGPSPNVSVQIQGESITYPRRHASVIAPTTAPNWIYASGVRGADKIVIRLANKEAALENCSYHVRLFFCEPSGSARKPATVQIRLQAKVVVQEFDLMQTAGGYDRGAMLRFDSVNVPDSLEITLARTPGANTDSTLPVLCGVEVVRANSVSEE